MCIKQHFVTLARVGHQPEGTTGTQLQMGYLQLIEHTANQQAFLTPVKLECLAELETQRYKGFGGIFNAFLSPCANEIGNGAVATPVSLRPDLGI